MEVQGRAGWVGRLPPLDFVEGALEGMGVARLSVLEAHAAAPVRCPCTSVRMGSSIVFQVMYSQLSGCGSTMWIVPTGVRRSRVAVDSGVTWVIAVLPS